MPSKRFGKYRTRQKAKRGGSVVNQKTPEVQKVIQKPEIAEVAEVAEAKPLVLRSIMDDFRDLSIKGVSLGGALHPHMDKMHFGISDYGYKHLKHAAGHILGKANPLISHHHHDVTAAMDKIKTIHESSKSQLRKHLRNPDMHRAISDVMHVAEKGGAVSMKHELGGGIDANQALGVARTIADPIKEAQKAKSQYDKINVHDRSARGFGSNATHALGGNFHVAAGHMKAANIATAGVFSGALLPASNAFSAVGDGIGSIF